MNINRQTHTKVVQICPGILKLMRGVLFGRRLGECKKRKIHAQRTIKSEKIRALSKSLKVRGTDGHLERV